MTAEVPDLLVGAGTVLTKEQAAVAMHNSRMYENLRKQNEELALRERRQALVNESSMELSSSLETDAVLLAAARRLTAIVGVSACQIFKLVNDEEIVCVQERELIPACRFDAAVPGGAASLVLLRQPPHPVAVARRLPLRPVARTVDAVAAAVCLASNIARAVSASASSRSRGLFPRQRAGAGG